MTKVFLLVINKSLTMVQADVWMVATVSKDHPNHYKKHDFHFKK